MHILLAASAATTAATSNVPTWAFSLAISLITLLLGLIGWLLRREIQNKEQEIQKLKNVLYGYTGEDGTRKAGVMERLDNQSETRDRFYSEFDRFRTRVKEKEVISEQNQTQLTHQVEQNGNEIIQLRGRLTLAESWIQEESERNRRAVQDTTQRLSEIEGKLEVLIGLVSNQNKS